MGSIRPSKGWSNISTKFEPMPDGEYLLVIKEIRETNEQGEPLRTTNGYRQVIVISKVDDPEHPEFNGRELYDYVVLESKDGENEAGYRRIKQYAEATLGEDEASDDDLDIQNCVNAPFVGMVTSDSYKVKDKTTGQETGEVRRNNKIKRVLPAQ